MIKVNFYQSFNVVENLTYMICQDELLQDALTLSFKIKYYQRNTSNKGNLGKPAVS